MKKCMKLYYDNTIYPLTDVTSWCITSSLGGNKSMQFDIPPQSDVYKYIEEEGRIEYDGTYYNIKSINERHLISSITAEIDLDGLKTKMFQTFNHQTISLAEAMSYILDGTGWSIVGAGLVTSKRSFELTDVTTLDIVDKCTEKTMYNVSFDIDNINKILNVSVPTTVAENVYFTEQLNLKELNFKGSSSNFVTRLYPYGKDGLSVASINGGNEYIDNNTYSNKIISMIWRDERYTDKTSLFADAKLKLAEMAVPERSYECSIIDIARLNTDEYSDFYIKLNSIITLIDQRKNKRIEHTVVEIKEYPNDAVNNTVTLSTTPQKISKKLINTSAQINSINSTVNKQPSRWEQAIATATSLITGADGGYVVLNPSKKPSEILIMNTPDINTATKVWRWNSGGLGYSANGYSGPYTTAITMNGEIVADFITAGGMNAERITAGILQGIKIIATTGSIAGWEMQNGKLTSADGSLNIDSGNNTINVNDNSGNKLMSINSYGIRFWRDSTEIGNIGITKGASTDTYGITFNLVGGDAMTWSMYDKSSGVYVNKLRYEPDTGLKLSGDLTVTGDIKDANLVNGITTDGYAPISGEYPVVTDIHQNADGTISWTTTTMSVRNGLITAL